MVQLTTTLLLLFQPATFPPVYLKFSCQKWRMQKEHRNNLTNDRIYSKVKWFSPVGSRKGTRGSNVLHEEQCCPLKSSFTHTILTSLAKHYTLEITADRSGALQANLSFTFLSWHHAYYSKIMNFADDSLLLTLHLEPSAQLDRVHPKCSLKFILGRVFIKMYMN